MEYLIRAIGIRTKLLGVALMPLALLMAFILMMDLDAVTNGRPSLINATMISVFALSACAALLLAMHVARRFVTHIDEAIEMVEAMKKGDLALTEYQDTDDEFGALLHVLERTRKEVKGSGNCPLSKVTKFIRSGPRQSLHDADPIDL